MTANRGSRITALSRSAPVAPERRSDVCSPPRPASGEWPRPSSERWTSTAPGGSPSISYFGTEIISVVTIHGNDSRANRKVHVFERQRDVRSEVVIRSELTVSADCSKLLSFAPITARPPMRPRRRSGCFQPSADIKRLRSLTPRISAPVSFNKSQQKFHNTKMMCELLGVSPSGYCAWPKKPISMSLIGS